MKYTISFCTLFGTFFDDFIDVKFARADLSLSLCLSLKMDEFNDRHFNKEKKSQMNAFLKSFAILAFYYFGKISV